MEKGFPPGYYSSIQASCTNFLKRKTVHRTLTPMGGASSVLREVEKELAAAGRSSTDSPFMPRTIQGQSLVI